MRKQITKDEALLSMADLCARSEQCAFDITKKLSARGLPPGDVRSVISELEERGFIDAGRYARAFSRDKVRFSAWGRLKIRAALLAKRIPEAVVREAFEDVDPDDYADALTRAARAKSAGLDLSSYDDRLKLYRHLLSRGFESSLASAEVKKFWRGN